MYKAIDIVKLKEKNTKFDKERYQKACFMYVWQMMLNDVFIMGRTWDEFKSIMEKIQDHFRLNENKYIIIYRFRTYINISLYMYETLNLNFNLSSIILILQRYLQLHHIKLYMHKQMMVLCLSVHTSLLVVVLKLLVRI